MLVSRLEKALGVWNLYRFAPLLAPLFLAGCAFAGGNSMSAAKVDCLNRCARWKDDCLLNATNSAQIAHCDQVAQHCSKSCR